MVYLFEVEKGAIRKYLVISNYSFNYGFNHRENMNECCIDWRGAKKSLSLLLKCRFRHGKLARDQREESFSLPCDIRDRRAQC